MKNTLEDLNNHLFAAIERLNDEEISEDELEKELKRAEGMTKVAGQIIQNAELAYKTMCHIQEYGFTAAAGGNIPAMLETKTNG